MKKQAADAVIEGADDVFGLAVLGRCIGTREAEDNAVFFTVAAERHGYRIPCRCQSERQEGED